MCRKAFLILFCFGYSTILFAQDAHMNPILKDQFYVEAGIFVPSKNVKLGANGSTKNDLIDFGNTFNLNDNQITYFFNLEWRWNSKWRATIETFGINNASKATLDKDIQFEDLVFEAGSFVRGGFDLSVYRVFVGRVISSGSKHSLGAGLGIHALNTGAYIEGEVRSNEGNYEFQNRKVSALLPLPNIGAWYHWGPSPKWVLIARADWFGITIGKYGGSLWNLAPGLRYQITKNVGIGADYRYFFLNARVDEDNWEGKFNMSFSGPMFSVHGNF